MNILVALQNGIISETVVELTWNRRKRILLCPYMVMFQNWANL